MSYLIILMYMAIFSCLVSYGDRLLSVLEGEVAKLDFPYPCDSTKVTLQYGYKVPFYSSANSESIALPPRYELVNQNERDLNCSFHLTINPVLRNDEGTYILMAYKDGVMLPDYPRIGLRVNYPPGKASCELSNDYNDEDWLSLRCKAPIGTLPGKIVCYQDGIRLPSLPSPEENRKTLNQIILSRLAGLVYCCCSTIEQTKDECECNDFSWNPILNTELSNVTNPCAATIQIPEQESTTSEDLTENSTTYPTALNSLKARNIYTSDYWLYVVIAISVLTVCTLIALSYFFFKARLSKNQYETGNTDDLQIARFS